MPAFVAVMGRRLSVRALIDGAETTKVTSKVLSAARAAGVDAAHITVIGQLEGLPETADIEDLFSTKDYLWLHNRATEVTIHETDLVTPDNPLPILQRVGIARQKQNKLGTSTTSDPHTSSPATRTPSSSRSMTRPLTASRRSSRGSWPEPADGTSPQDHRGPGGSYRPAYLLDSANAMEVDDGVALTTELSRWPGRALYDPRPGEPRTPGPSVSCRVYYSGGPISLPVVTRTDAEVLRSPTRSNARWPA
ncbi:hypothetical protein ACWEL8_28525 [Streptomyces sp. NPDC004690]